MNDFKNKLQKIASGESQLFENYTEEDWILAELTEQSLEQLTINHK